MQNNWLIYIYSWHCSTYNVFKTGKRSNARPDITGDLLTITRSLKSEVLHCLHLDGSLSCYLVKVSSSKSSDSTTADFFSHSNGQKSLAPGKRHSNVWRRMNRISSVTINQVDNLQVTFSICRIAGKRGAVAGPWP